jgi:hypothetical protein
MPIELNYRGVAGVEDMNAFNARTNVSWKGDLLFRIYAMDGKIYFIKVGGSKTANQAVAVQFGLIGILIAHFMGKSQEKKTKERLYAVAGVSPEELLAGDKVNSVMSIDEISEPTIQGGSMWSGGKFGSFRFRDAKGKKRVYTFEDGDNFQLAVRRLGEVLGERLTVLGKWDEQKGKVVKV